MAVRSPAPTPLERVHFLEEQRRHRRTSAVSAALVVVVLAVSGIPLSVVISPVLVAAAAVPVYLADLVFDMPADVTGWLDRTFHLLPTMWSAVRRPDVDMPWELLAALFVLPGIVAMLLLWAVVRLTFRRTGVGGVLRRMEARPPRPGDLAEQRLANLVEEVAVARIADAESRPALTSLVKRLTKSLYEGSVDWEGCSLVHPAITALDAVS